MREKLIELLKKKYDHYCDQCGVNKQSHYIENLADYLISHGVTVQEWIPVTERLPERNCLVFAVIDHVAGTAVWAREYGCLEFNSQTKMFNASIGERVTHWMPMPQLEPPKGD